MSTHVIRYQGLWFHLPLCEEHGTALKAAEGTEAPLTPSPGSEEVIRITQGQETIAQICYTHGRPAITIAFPGEASLAELQEEVSFLESGVRGMKICAFLRWPVTTVAFSD